jgi:very-short-patch-repair endonuclease
LAGLGTFDRGGNSAVAGHGTFTGWLAAGLRTIHPREVGRKGDLPQALTAGPFTLADAREAGLERWHLRSEKWRRLARGMYVWSGVAETPLTRLQAASMRLPNVAAFSGLTAAWLHGLDVDPCDPIEVTLPRDAGISGRAGMRVRRSPLRSNDVVRLRGLRATSIVRTLVEVCARLSLTEAVVMVDGALHKHRVTAGQLTSSENTMMKRILRFAEPAAESPMESRLRMVLVLAGLPRPQAQVSIYDSNGRFAGRPDLYYEEARLGIEYDGAVHRESLAQDNRRQNNLLNAGVRLLRFTGADVLHNPGFVVHQVRSMLSI